MWSWVVRVLVALAFFALYYILFVHLLGPGFLIVAAALKGVPIAPAILKLFGDVFVQFGVWFAIALAVLNFAVGWPWAYRGRI